MRIAGVSVDPPSHNGAMVEKLDLPFPLLSDPRGELAQRCDLWNADEGVAVPAILVVNREGIVRYLYKGEDFADRPGDDEVLGALDGMPDAVSGEGGGAGEAEIRVTVEEAESVTVRPERPPITLDQLVPYYRGVFFTTVALKRRFGKLRDAFKEVDRYQRVTKEYQAAIQETRKAKRGS